MFKRSAGCVVCLSLLLLFVSAPASADATFTTATVTCSSFTATGTVTSAYVGIRVWNTTAGQYEGGPALIDSYYDVGAPAYYFPASGGSFSFTVNFPPQNPGDTIVARVYGTDTPAFGGWDGGTFPQIEGTCAAAVPTLSGWMLALFAIVLGAAGLYLARRQWLA